MKFSLTGGLSIKTLFFKEYDAQKLIIRWEMWWFLYVGGISDIIHPKSTRWKKKVTDFKDFEGLGNHES